MMRRPDWVEIDDLMQRLKRCAAWKRPAQQQEIAAAATVRRPGSAWMGAAKR